MRDDIGALAPCIPEGLAPTLFLHSHGAGLLQESGVIVGRRGARYQRAHNESESKTQVWFAGPQPMRRPQNSAGNARQHYEKYLARAREAKLSGDEVEMENCYQHAEHYFRVMRGTGDDRRYYLQDAYPR